MDTDPHRTVDLYARADVPALEQRDAVVRRLARAVRAARIDEFEVHTWPPVVSLDTTRGGTIHETVRSFEQWASRHGCRIRPSFQVRTVHSSIVDETDDRLVLPVLCVAAYVDGELVALAPCRDGESTLTVDDVLTAIETGETGLPEAEPGEAAGDPPRGVAGSESDAADGR